MVVEKFWEAFQPIYDGAELRPLEHGPTEEVLPKTAMP